MATSKCYDVLGIGFGPGNIALAAAFEELYPEISVKFIEGQSATRWQENMMIVDADIQHSAVMDLVTPRNPQSPYSFLNYLHRNNRLFKHFNLGLEYPLREEYSDYVSWVARQFDHLVDYGVWARKIELNNDLSDQSWRYSVLGSNGETYYCRALVLATGRTPNIPSAFNSVPEDKLIHLSEYLTRINAEADSLKSVAVIGASQSAVEIILDLTERFQYLKVSNYIRHFAYRLKDLSPQMESSIYPEYVREHFDRTWEQRKRFNNDLKYQNYSSADMDVLKELNTRNYMHELSNGAPLYELINNCSIDSVSYSETEGKVNILSSQIYTQEVCSKSYDKVVLATGFKDLGPGAEQEQIPQLLGDLTGLFEFDEQGVVCVEFNYNIVNKDPKTPPVYLNGLCEGTHGVSDAGSFSLLALRSQKIVDSVAAYLHGVTHEDIVQERKTLQGVFE